MDGLIADSFVPQVVVAASEDCQFIYESSLFSGSAVHAAGDSHRIRLCRPPSVEAAHAAAAHGAQIDIEAETRRLHREHGADYFPKLLTSVVLSTLGAARAQPFETFGHPVACILVVSSRNPNPISALTQLYQQSYQEYSSFMSPDFLRCVWYVNRGSEPASQEPASQEPASQDFAAVNSQFGPYCYEISGADYLPGIAAAASGAVYPYMRQVVKQWQEAHTARSTATFGFGKLLKKLVTNGPPRPETNIFYDVCRELQPHVAAIPAPRKVHAVDLDMQLRRLADVAFMLGELKLAFLAYDALRKPFMSEKLWAHFGSVHEMLALTAALSQQAGVDGYLDTALYTYDSRCHLPVYVLRSTLLVSEAMADNGSELAAAGWLGTLLLAVDPELGSGSEPAEAAMLMDRTARAFERRGWQRKTSLWTLLANKEWQRSEAANQALQRSDAANQALQHSDAANEALQSSERAEPEEKIAN